MKFYQPETVVLIISINFCISGYQKLGCLEGTTVKMDAIQDLKSNLKSGILGKAVQMYFAIGYPDYKQMKK